MDPFSLLLAAQTAVAAIRSGCQLLQEGKAEIGKIKKAVEDAQAIVKDVRGVWFTIRDMLVTIFGGKPDTPVPPVEATKPAPAAAAPVRPKAKKPEPEPELSYEEYQTRAIHEVCEQLKTFFEIRRKLTEYCRELEEISKTTTTIEDSALDRVEIEMQLEMMTTQIRETMVYAPRELRDIYSRFLKMYDRILEEQEFARQVKRKRERDEAARRWRQKDKRIELAVEIVGAAVLLVVVGAVMWDLKMQTMARSVFWGAY